VIYIDLDNFKPVNDNYGHKAGDQVLQVIAERIRKSLRQSDTVARIGGDEFCVILEDVDGKSKELAEAQAKKMGLPIPLECGAVVQVNASWGVSTYPMDKGTPEQMLTLADHRMYEHKRTNKKFDITTKTNDNRHKKSLSLP
jgi:diguanylate cyclase (GGDEF)-like protein